MQPDFEVWKEYAYEQGIHPAVISYLELRRKNFYRMENTVDGRNFCHCQRLGRSFKADTGI